MCFICKKLERIVNNLNIHRAGRLLDVAKSGYYNSDMCVEDFELVS